MLVNFAVGLVTWSLVLTWVAGSLGGLSYWFWSVFLPQDDFYLADVIVSFFTGGAVTGVGRAGESIMHLMFGVFFAVTLPFITRGLLRVHHWIAEGMLGAWRSDELAQQVDALAASRGAAVAAEGHSLRRLERDIHDGPQQRLVRLQSISPRQSARSRPTRKVRAPASPRPPSSRRRPSTSCGPCRAGSRRRFCSTAASPPLSSRSRCATLCPSR